MFKILEEIEILGNTLAQYIYFVALFLILSLVFYIFKTVLLKKLKNIAKQNEITDTIVRSIYKISLKFYAFISLYIALNIITVPNIIDKIMLILVTVWSGYVAVIIAQIFIDFFAKKYFEAREEREKSAFKIIVKVAKGLLWIFAVLIVLSTLGVNITAAVAGMGIGGVAVAFALQNILTDLFSSFAIYFDKPFVEEDFIIVGDKMGVVEKIGIKTTRLRALQGEEIVMSNRELTSVQIHNFKKMQKRRASFDFGVEYETSSEKLEKIPKMIEKIIKKEKLADFDRAHFSKFGDFSLDFTVVYYIDSADFTDYMNTQQNILFKIKREFEKEGISMAFPTQTIQIKK